MSADRLVHILNRDFVTLPRPRRDRSAVQHQAGHVQPRQGHGPRRDGLVAPDENDETVEAVSTRDQLDRIGDDFAAHQRGAHPLRAHGDAVRDGDGVELHRRAARLTDAVFHVHRQIAEVKVAGTDLDPRVRHADERFL